MGKVHTFTFNQINVSRHTRLWVVLNLLALLNLFILPVGVNASEAQPIPITIHVDDAYPPYSYADETGAAKGLYINVLRTAFARIKAYNVTLKPIPWQRGKRLMEQGQGMGLAPAFYHGHDWPYLHPYSLPFYTETVQLYCREDLIEADQKWPQDFQQYRIGNVTGFDGWGGTEFHQLVQSGQIKYTEAPSSSLLIKSGMKDRVDCLLMEQTAFQLEYDKLVKEMDRAGTVYNRLSAGPITGKDPVYIGYSIPARETGKYPFIYDFMQAFDNEIYRMQKTGEIEQIMGIFAY